jgi:WD40 repeat protein
MTIPTTIKKMPKSNPVSSFSKSLQITGHQGPIYALSQDQNYIYSASADKFVARWRKDTGQQDHFAIRCTQAPFSLLVLPELQQLIIGLSDGSLHVIDTEQKIEVKYLKAHQSAVFSIAVNSHLQQRYTADADGNLFVWDADWNLLLRLPLACGKIRQIAVATDGSFFVLACADGYLRKFDTTFFNEAQQIYAHHEGCTALCLMPNNDILSGGKDAYIRRWSETGQKLKAFPAHLGTVYQILLLSSAGYATASRDKTIKIWSAQDDHFVFKIDMQMAGHRHSINALLHTPDGFASAGDDKRIIFWRSSEEKSS